MCWLRGPTASGPWPRPQATIWWTRQQPGNHLADIATTSCWKLPAGCRGPPAVAWVHQPARVRGGDRITSPAAPPFPLMQLCPARHAQRRVDSLLSSCRDAGRLINEAINQGCTGECLGTILIQSSLTKPPLRTLWILGAPASFGTAHSHFHHTNYLHCACKPSGFLLPDSCVGCRWQLPGHC